MTRFLGRTALFSAAAVIAGYAVLRDSPDAPRPGELLDGADHEPAVWLRPDTLSRGETLEIVLRRGGLGGNEAREILTAAPSLDPRRLRAGMAIEFVADSDTAAPREIRLKLALDSVLRVSRGDDGLWMAEVEHLPWETDTVVVQGVVPPGGSLTDALGGSGGTMFPGGARHELVGRISVVYDHRVDWFRDLQPGDSLYALVERARGPEETVRAGRVLAARLHVRGRGMEAFHFADDQGRPKYYDATGKSLATAFLLAPLDVRRVTSGFGNRFHPVLRTWRAHQGVDYGAATGTPVRTVGDGRVVRAVFQPGGYGNVVDIEHSARIGGRRVVTRYAHLSRFGAGIRAGAPVSMGQTIGYVGATGMVTGPHLHFEVLVNGTQRNPREVLALTDGTPVPDQQRLAFEQTRDVFLAALGQQVGPVAFAAASP